MARRRGPPQASAKGKRKVTITPITDDNNEVVRLGTELRKTVHERLDGCRIACAWRFGWKPDADGNTQLYAVKKASDFERLKSSYDFVVIVGHEFWNSSGCTREHKLFILDQALTHIQAAVDTNGDQKEDENGSPVWRLRKPDVVTFVEVVGRRGPMFEELRDLQRRLRAFDATDDLPFEATTANVLGKAAASA
jgi:hypothetical protein